MSFLKLSFAKRKYVVNKAKILVVLAVVLLILALDLFFVLPWSFSRLNLLKFTILDLIFTPTILIVFVWGILKAWSWLEKRMDEKLDQFHKNWKNAERGFKGEDLVYAELQRILDPNSYHIFRNIVLKGKKWDMDFVIVGPKGIILLEVKNFQESKVSFTASKQFFFSNRISEWIQSRFDLRNLIGRSAFQLEKYFAENNLDGIHVRRVILYIKPDSVHIKEYGGNKNHVYIIQGIDKLSDYIAGITPDKMLDLDVCLKINDILNRL